MALNDFLFYLCLLLLSKPKALDLLCNGMWWMLELWSRLCEDPTVFCLSLPPARLEIWSQFENSNSFLTYSEELVTICKH